MSGFVVLYERSNNPVDPGVFERAMQRLSHRGPDGHDAITGAHFAMGHWHFWSTPEEVGERQPLALAGLPYKLVLDGRLDNRDELFAKLQIGPAQGQTLSDAALLLRAYAHWGQACFAHFIGDYALVLLDEKRGELFCARDALGDRTLFYAFKGSQLVIASEPWAVAGADDNQPELNESAAACYLANRAIKNGQTYFKNIHELLPAHAMCVDQAGYHVWRTWEPDLSRRLRGRTDAEYAEEFRSLLEQSVRCRLRASTPVGVLMSGGLDSTSVACLAAGMLAPERLTTISYVYDELKECDERQYIQAVIDLHGLHSIQIPCDDAWPLKDWQNWPFDPNHPTTNPIRWLPERAYLRAQQEGMRVLMTGSYGDHLYAEGDNCLAELLSEKRFTETIREIRIGLSYFGIKKFIDTGLLQQIVKRFFPRIVNFRRLFLRAKAPNWLTSFAARLLPDAETDRYHQISMLGVRVAQNSSNEVTYASRHAVELRHPYRDRRLVEYVLALPAYQLYYQGIFKHVLRTAMRGILPETIRLRLYPTYMNSLFFRGFEMEQEIIQACAKNTGADWRKYVRSNWLSKRWVYTPKRSLPEMNVPWLCIAHEAWLTKTFKPSLFSETE